MNRTIEMILMTLVIILIAAFLGTTMISCTSNDDDQPEVYKASTLYAIVKPEGAQLIDIIPQDYVLTLDNIIAVNPEKGEFKLMHTERIDSVAFPIPTQYVIQFYTKGSFLFEAKLTSLLSSTASSGLTFCHFISEKNGLARYDLYNTNYIQENGTISGEMNKEQEQGVLRLYQILGKHGKTKRDIDYYFEK